MVILMKIPPPRAMARSAGSQNGPPAHTEPERKLSWAMGTGTLAGGQAPPPLTSTSDHQIVERGGGQKSAD